LTALSIAQRLGYISVVEILRHITDVTVTPAATEDKYKVIAPETMQEAPMSDSEEEGGEYVTPSLSPAVSYCSVRKKDRKLVFLGCKCAFDLCFLCLVGDVGVASINIALREGW